MRVCLYFISIMNCSHETLLEKKLFRYSLTEPEKTVIFDQALLERTLVFTKRLTNRAMLFLDSIDHDVDFYFY